MGRRKFEAGILRASRLPDRNLAAGRRDATAESAIAEEASQGLNTSLGDRHACTDGGIAGKAVYLQRRAPPATSRTFLRALTTSAPDQGSVCLSGSPQVAGLSFSGHATRTATMRCDTQYYVLWFV